MTLPSYLTLSRHNIYYYRFPIPKALQPELKSSFVRLSLGTPNKREAMVIANNGKEAIQKLEKDESDLVIMDVQMPVMDDYISKPLNFDDLSEKLNALIK